MADEKTIAALKTNFLRQQIRILSQPLKLSDKAKERIELSDGDLRDIMLRGICSLICNFRECSGLIRVYCSKSDSPKTQ
jgi:hypothetical protein